MRKLELDKVLNEIEHEYLPYLNGEKFEEEIREELAERFEEDGYPITKESVIGEMLWCYLCRMQ